MSDKVTIPCPGCNTQLACAAYSWITPTVVGRWLIPDHRAQPIGNTIDVAQPDATFRITMRCVYSGAYVERHAADTVDTAPLSSHPITPGASHA